MSPRRTILYLFLAGILTATNARSQPHWPDTVIAPHPNLHNADTIIVHFDVDQSSLSPEADSILDAYFKTAGSIRQLTISGYCDITGPQAYNNRLSTDRAISVRDYLRQHWQDTTTNTNLTGNGTRDPIGDNSTGSGRALNRRVTIIAAPVAQPVTSTTKPAPSTPQPVTSTTQPVTSTTQPVTSTPQPVTSTPQQFTSTTQLDTSNTQPSPSIAQPAATQVPPTIYKAITDTATRVGTSIVLKDVVFYGGVHIPMPFAYNTLDELVKAMQDNKKLRIRIEGHICCMPDGTDSPDAETGKTDLSVQRAKVVFDYLIQHGIPKHRMSYIGLGASGKLYPQEHTAAQQAANRRVEIRVLAK